MSEILCKHCETPRDDTDGPEDFCCEGMEIEWFRNYKAECEQSIEDLAEALMSAMDTLRTTCAADNGVSLILRGLELQLAKVTGDYQQHVAMVASKDRPAYDEQQGRIAELERQLAELRAEKKHWLGDW